MAAFMMDLLFDTNVKVEDVDDYDLKSIIQMVLVTRHGWETKLRFIHDTNRVLMTRGARLCVLTPIFTVEAKYITIDTDVLHSLLGSKKGTGLGKSDFGRDQVLSWIKNFRLPPKLFPEGREDRRFWFTVTTDGVGASLIVQNWKWIRKVTVKSTAAEKLAYMKNLKEARLTEVRTFVASFDKPPSPDGLLVSIRAWVTWRQRSVKTTLEARIASTRAT